MKEFIFLSKQLGLGTAVSYFFYKINLKLLNTPFFKNRRKKSRKRIELVYAAISAMNSDKARIGNTDYIVKSIPGNNGKLYLRPYTSDEMVYQQVMVAEEYRAVKEMYDQVFKDPPALVVDCGSNIGLAGIYFALAYPAVRIIAIEPFAENAALASLNFKAAGLHDFRMMEGGVWNKDGWLSVNRNFRDQKEWSVQLTESAQGENNIKAYSLAGIIESCEREIDILKIDIEGAEVALFSDSNYASSFLKKVKCLAIEIHDEFDIREKISEALKKNNFFFYNSNEITIAINRSYTII